jgi:glutathione S-transferase
MNCGLRVRLREIPPALQRDLDRIDELWSEGLQRFGGPFLAGAAFSAVDAFYAPVAFRARTYGLALSTPATAYVARLLALPSMLDWNRAALVEPWRDEEHEVDALTVGTLLEDLRAPASPR